MLKTKITDFLNKYETRMEIAFFVGGFLFDIWMLAAPDEIFSIIQQIVYLAIIAMLIHFELLHRLQKWRPQGRLVKIWNYRTFILHFLLGSLLSVYSLFYIKSSSLFGSLIFLIFMISLLLANELPFVKKSNVSLKVGLYAICLFSFLSIVYPIAYGSIGLIPFFFSIITTLAIFYFHFNYLKNLITERYILIKALLAPAYSIMGIFFVFYFLGWIPPVPLSVKSHGIYHFIEKKEGNYYLSFVDHFFSFLYPSDLEFSAQPLDKIYYYAQIYSPARISAALFPGLAIV